MVVLAARLAYAPALALPIGTDSAKGGLGVALISTGTTIVCICGKAARDLEALVHCVRPAAAAQKSPIHAALPVGAVACIAATRRFCLIACNKMNYNAETLFRSKMLKAELGTLGLLNQI